MNNIPVNAVEPPHPVQQVPVGALTGAVGIGMLTGGLAAQALHTAAPTIGVLLTIAIGLGLYVLIRIIAQGDAAASARAAVVLSATGFALFYYLVLAGETWHPHRVPAGLARATQAVTFLARMLVAASLPVALASLAAWHAAGAARREVPAGRFAPLFVAVGLGAVGFVASMTIFLVAIAIVPPRASGYVAVSTVLLLPLVFRGVWTYVYCLILSHWEVDALPESLVRSLADLRARCGFQFDRVICLGGRYGNGRIACVTSSPRSSTLLVSEPLTHLLDRDELFAILAHETAHIELSHLGRKAVFGVVATAVGLSCYVAVFIGLRGVIPREPGLVLVLVTSMLFAVGRSAYDAFVTRRHEQEADAYAARAAGAGALLSALEKLGAGRSPIRVANRWTTHSTWEIRARRLRELAAREPLDK